MHIQTVIGMILLGLLGPIWSPEQSLVVGRTLSGTKSTRAREVRSLLSGLGVNWNSKPQVEKNKIVKQEVISKEYHGRLDSDDISVWKASVAGFGEVWLKYQNSPRYLNAEIRAYQEIEKIEGNPIGPEFKAIVIDENGRRVGFLIELLDGVSKPTKDDKDNCVETLKAFHKTGLIHSDVNLGNFLIKDRSLVKDRSCYIIDFQYAHRPIDPEAFGQEIIKFENNIDAA
ncbi:Uu.00g041080.m01.CDS01 [Anthostomella pinea]|uniref:Uu.00g041080.m01.CDS01 n=1 Tax=Anthostomella pinea TaxID=933095 RepID=A0AAI8YDZ5_9PEZI|nr:Uu.00g041080.m01.CDS01 [Anthostomella pinea]